MNTAVEPYLALEREWARWAGIENVVGCSSGTAALHLALESMGIPLGSGVIVPDYTMVACARAVSLAGMLPTFIDCRERDLLIDPKLIEEGITDRTRAIMAVHIYGRYCDMNAIHEIAGKYGLVVIEDMAEIHGVPPHPNSHAACWSFYRNKIVAGEEGGAVAFREAPHASVAKSLRSLGFTRAHDYIHTPRGHNYRMSNAHALLVLDSIRASSGNISRRRIIEDWYNQIFIWDREWLMPKRDAAWVYDLHIPGMIKPQQTWIIKTCNDNGIRARHGFKPMHWQEEYSRCRRVGGEVAEKLADEVIYLPIEPGVTTPEMVKTARRVILDGLRYT